MLAQAGLVTLFNTVGVATQHPHWFKEPEDVEPIVGPLCRIIETLPAPMLKSFEKRFNTIALCGGIALVTIPDVTAEIKIRRAEFDAKTQQGASRGPSPTGHVHSQGQAPEGHSGLPGGIDGKSTGGANGNGPDLRDTLPPTGLEVTY